MCDSNIHKDLGRYEYLLLSYNVLCEYNAVEKSCDKKIGAQNMTQQFPTLFNEN